jgi:predicted DCC family thiol-disulfide oxidoreductase YuxK
MTVVMQPLLLFDGTCGFCARSVQFVLHRERRRTTLRFASLDSPTGVAIQARHPELAGVDSVFWVEPRDAAGRDRVYGRSDAVLRVMHYLGGAWSVLAAIGALVPRFVRDPVYDLVARHRHEIGAASCLVPTAEQRDRFLDWESVGGA